MSLNKGSCAWKASVEKNRRREEEEKRKGMEILKSSLSLFFLSSLSLCRGSLRFRSLSLSLSPQKNERRLSRLSSLCCCRALSPLSLSSTSHAARKEKKDTRREREKKLFFLRRHRRRRKRMERVSQRLGFSRKSDSADAGGKRTKLGTRSGRGEGWFG
jgi:hypothetical protein